jgi:hypothetical protein
MNLPAPCFQLTVNPYSRPGRMLLAKNGIILHWTGKAWQRALTVWREVDYPKAGHYSSSNYSIDTNGDIYQFAPDGELPTIPVLRLKTPQADASIPIGHGNDSGNMRKIQKHYLLIYVLSV